MLFFSNKIHFPDIELQSAEEKALRNSNFGKFFFKFVDVLFPVFKEPNWFDLYDPPPTPEENLVRL